MNLDTFIAKYWGKPGGAERATYQLFLTELAQLLGAPTPDPGEGGVLGNYQFEGPVRSEAVFLSKHNKRIDLYKRDCFILEAKQSQLKPGEVLPESPPEDALEPVHDLFGNITGHQAPSGKRKPRYDRLMADARIQAERYSLALPSTHKPPPFLIVADIGRAFEFYFDWTGDGRGYGFFPDQQSYRITLEQLRDEATRDLLKGIWLDPASVDPRKKAVAVTRDIAERLSRVAEALEKDERERGTTRDRAEFEVALGIEQTSLFLMRVLFCMFAEDVELLPKDRFTRFLDEARGKTDLWWRRGLSDLWATMNQADELNRFWSYGDAIVRYFNGNLFTSAAVYDLPPEFKGELFEAAKRDWRSVEPAIFGTLLEQVLTPGERAKLGAHYTPRPYVQRLVNATIGDVLVAEWEAVREQVRELLAQSSPERGGGGAADGGVGTSPHKPRPEASTRPLRPSGAPPRSGEDLRQEALALLRAFHTRLCTIRVLDPACGTGNFLYVAMELLLLLESNAIQLAAELGEELAPAVHPNQFLGLELNSRAAVISELVLWIGWLRHRLANHPDAIGDPVLPTLSNINFGTHGGYDAVLRHLPTGAADTAHPAIPPWPEAHFIVGNPPFIGKGSIIREALGDDYVAALWAANPRVPKSADFVMQWWDRAAHILTAPGSTLQRFGFVTTNSITQTFSRRVIEGYLNSSPDRGGGPAKLVEGHPPESPTSRGQDNSPVPLHHPADGPPPPAGEEGLSLILAIPDHPWTRATKDAAAVRIAMTVAQAGQHQGRLIEITGESGLDSDNPVLVETERFGRINPDLTLGADVTVAKPLKANDGLSCNGIMLAGKGFKITNADAEMLLRKDGEQARAVIHPHIGGSELVQRIVGEFVIDFNGLTETEARKSYPNCYQHLLEHVKPERDISRDKAFRERWWIFGRVRPEIRAANRGLPRYIATTRTSRHRVFQFVNSDVLSNHEIIVISSADAFLLGTLSSNIHSEWVLQAGGWLGVGNDSRYNKSQTFDPFPFPDATPQQRAQIAELAEELDATRKQALTEVPGLTMTAIYNWREKLRSGVELSPQEADSARAARAGIVDRLHQQIDAAVAEAYGWPADLPPAEIVARLVALNAERAAEEKAGTIRWLRPDYQISRFGAGKG